MHACCTHKIKLAAGDITADCRYYVHYYVLTKLMPLRVALLPHARARDERRGDEQRALAPRDICVTSAY